MKLGAKQLDSRHWLAGLATTLSAATVLVIATALVRWHMSIALAVLILVLSLAAGIGFMSRLGPDIFGPRPADEPITKPRLYFVLAIIALSLYAFILVPLWTRPDISWDAMAYHLPAIQFWMQHGNVYWIGANDGWDPLWDHYFIDPLMNGYPKGAETIGFLLTFLTGGHLSNAWNFFFMPLGVLGIYVGGRELGGGRATSLFAGALFAIVPVNVSQSTCAYVDTGYAAAIAGFFALLVILVRRLFNGERVTWPLVVVAGELLGLALGIKPPATMATVVSVGVLGLLILYLTRKKPPGERRGFLLAQSGRLVALVAVTLLVGGYWYARNYSYRDNPLFPVEVKLAGKVLFPGTPLEQQITMDGVTPDYIKPWSTPRQVVYSWMQSARIEFPPDEIVEHDADGWALDLSQIKAVREPAWPRTIRYQDSRIGGLGFAWLGASLPAAVVFLIWLARRWRRTRDKSDLADLAAFASMAFIVLVCFLGSPLKWWARYTIWIEVPGFIALGVVIHRFDNRILRAAMLGISVLTGLEYGYSMKWAASQPYFVGPGQLHATLNPVAIVRAVTTTDDNGCGAIFHRIPRGLVHEALCSATPIAIAPITLPHLPIMGQLSSPPGARTIFPAPPGLGTNEAWVQRFLADHHPRFVIWDEGQGPAPALEARAKRIEHAYGFIFMDLTDDPPPAVLYPK